MPRRKPAPKPRAEPVSLARLVGEFESQSNDMEVYVDCATGETLACAPLLGDQETGRELDEGNWTAFPRVAPREEFRWMRAFAQAQPDGGARERLLDSLEGPRPFRAFKDAVHRLGVDASWYAARSAHHADILREWLPTVGLPFVDDVPPAAPPAPAPPRALYLVVETYRGGDAVPVHRRFRERGRLAPPGLEHVASWVDSDLRRCFQVMETADRALLDAWMAEWDDLVEFEVVPVMTSADAAARIAPRL